MQRKWLWVSCFLVFEQESIFSPNNALTSGEKSPAETNDINFKNAESSMVQKKLG